MTTSDNPDPQAPGWEAFTAPDLALFEQLAHEAVISLPQPWRDMATHVALRIVDFPPDDVLEAMDLHDPYELTGLYEGTPLTEKSVMDQPAHPDIVWLFRRPILDERAERGNVSIQELVTHVVIHEIAHHFGIDDDRLHELGWG